MSIYLLLFLVQFGISSTFLDSPKNELNNTCNTELLELF